MTLPRFYYGQELTPGLVRLGPDESRHATASLRLRDGDEVMLFDGCGRIAHGRLVAAEHRKEAARVHIEHILQTPAPARKLELIVAPCKGPRLSWMIEKLTELGASTITMTAFARGVVHPGENTLSKLRRIAIEASRQSERAWLPEIRDANSLTDALDSDAGVLLVADPDPAAPSLASWLHAHATVSHLRVVVGPEGGLTDEELRVLHEAGGQLVRLGENILRIETAALCVAANWSARAGAAATR